MSTDIEDQINNYFGWVESQTGLDLRPATTVLTDQAQSVRTTSVVNDTPVLELRVDAASHERARPTGRTMLLVAASIVMMVGGLAAIGSRGTDSQRVPVSQGAPTCVVAETPPPLGWEPCVVMKVFVQPNAGDEQIALIGDVLTDATDVIDEWTYLDTQASLEAAERELADEPETFELLNADNIPTRFDLIATPTANDTDLRQLAIRVQKLPSVATSVTRDEAKRWQTAEAEAETLHSTVAPVETTNVPDEDSPVRTQPMLVAIGDQSLLDIAEALVSNGFTVDALDGRTFQQVVEVIQAANKSGLFADTSAVVISAGSNGPITAAELDKVMAVLIDVPRVAVLTAPGDDDSVVENNRLVESLAQSYPNIVIVDWATAAKECRGNCFGPDGHLAQDGRELFSDLVNDAASEPGLG